MSKKLFSNLRATVKESLVEISCYLSTPLFSSRSVSNVPLQIQILRSEEKDFTFNHDYAEYFDGSKGEDAEVIFDGAVEFMDYNSSYSPRTSTSSLSGVLTTDPLTPHLDGENRAYVDGHDKWQPQAKVYLKSNSHTYCDGATMTASQYLANPSAYSIYCDPAWNPWEN